MIGLVWGPIGRSMPSLIAGLPARPMPGDPAVLDADVRLDDADHGIDDEGAGDDDVELRRRRRPAHWAIREPEVLRVAPDRLVAARRAVLLRPGSTGRCRRAGPDRRSLGP